MSSIKPCFVIAPANTLTPAHYGYLQHLLMRAGYPVATAMLPTTGTREPRSAQDDADYIRDHVVLPVLDLEGHNVIIVSHSYSGMPAGAAVTSLGPVTRAQDGKKTSVIGQIYIAAILPRGGDGQDVVATFGGQLPPHVAADEAGNQLRCDDLIPAILQDVDGILASAAAASCIMPCLTSLKTPCPRASWDEPEYRGRIAYIKTVRDQALPCPAQDMLLERTGQEWITRSIDSGHSPQLSKPEELCKIMLDLAELFETL